MVDRSSPLLIGLMLAGCSSGTDEPDVPDAPPAETSFEALMAHDGYWTAEFEAPGAPAPITAINDMHIDPVTGRATVYAQMRMSGQVLAPAQVAPGECTEGPAGEQCFHPNAVYLDGSGAESSVATGEGGWWVKHSWVVNGEGYFNCPLTPMLDESRCMDAEGVLLDDGLTMRIGGLGENANRFNTRVPLATNPATYEIRMHTPNSDTDPTPVEQSVLTLTCVEEESAFDGRARACPTSGAAPPAPEPEGPAVGFEILQILGPNQIRAWATADMTVEAFEALEVPMGWIKNQPRETDMDRGMFARSPDAVEDGTFVDEEHFGVMWRHVATVVETGVRLDDSGLLSGSRVAKFHTVSFDAGRTLNVLISPDGDQYVRITRDFGRTTDEPTLPTDWSLVQYDSAEMLDLALPDETLVIRADNEDSFQGPVAPLDLR